MIDGVEEGTMENTASLTSKAPVSFLFPCIRTRHVSEGVSGTTQLWVPSFSVETAIMVQEVPLSVE